MLCARSKASGGGPYFTVASSAARGYFQPARATSSFHEPVCSAVGSVTSPPTTPNPPYPRLWQHSTAMREVRWRFLPSPQERFHGCLGLAAVFPHPTAGMLLWGPCQGGGDEMCGAVTGCVPGASLFWDAGFAEQGRLASGQGVSILAGKSAGGGGGWRLPPHAFSRRDFSAAGREHGQGTGPARLQGTRLACWGVSHLGCGWGRGVPRVSMSWGLMELVFLGCCQGKGAGMGAGMLGRVFSLLSPPCSPLEGTEDSDDARCAPGISS